MLVHFPVAMVSLYAILEIGSVIPFIRKLELDITKAILLGVGFVFGMLSSQTGEMLEHNFSGIRNLVNAHSTGAFITNLLAGILCIIYFLYLLKPWYQKISTSPSFVKFAEKISSLITQIKEKRWLLIILACCLLAAVTVTGALGAAIVHGQDVDPVVNFIYTLFVK
jgi:uncharacterized membrane protein